MEFCDALQFELAFSCSTHCSLCKNSQDNLTRRRGVQQCAACPPSLSRILMPPHPTAIFWRMQYQGIKIYFPHIWRTIQLCDLLVHLQFCQKSSPAINKLLTLGFSLEPRYFSVSINEQAHHQEQNCLREKRHPGLRAIRAIPKTQLREGYRKIPFSLSKSFTYI